MSTDAGVSSRGMPAKDAALVDRILAPARPQQKYGLTVNEGFRFMTFGETGSGKTTLQRAVIYRAIEQRLAGFALVHDVKGIFPEYPKSVQLQNVNAFIARGGLQKGDIPVYSFRGDPRADVKVEAEEVAGFSRFLLKQGQEINGVWAPRPIITVIEETAEASTAGRKHIRAPSVLWLAEQGRKLGGSLVGTTQSPRKVPLDLPTQASSSAFFRLTGADANYLGNVMELDPEMIKAIRGPNNEGLPNFKFALAIKGEPWDREIHQLDRKTVAMFE